MAIPGITSPVPAETTDQINRFAEDAKKSSSDLQKGFLQGTEMPAFMAPGAGIKGQTDSKALSAAIDQRAMRGYRANMSQLKSDVEAKAIQQKFSRLTSAATLVSAEHQQNERIRMLSSDCFNRIWFCSHTKKNEKTSKFRAGN